MRTQSQVSWSFDRDVIAEVQAIAKHEGIRATVVANRVMRAGLGMNIEFPTKEKLTYPMIDIPEMKWRGDILKFEDAEAKIKLFIDYMRECKKNNVDIESPIYTKVADLTAIRAFQIQSKGERPEPFVNATMGRMKLAGYMYKKQLDGEFYAAQDLKFQIWKIENPPLPAAAIQRPDEKCVFVPEFFEELSTQTLASQMATNLVAGAIHDWKSIYRAKIVFDAVNEYRQHGITTFVYGIEFQFETKNYDDEENERAQFIKESWSRYSQFVDELQQLKPDLVISRCSTQDEFQHQIEAKGLTDARSYV